ncbi:MAG: (2Fe-2S) ferredoxin domain-containing protein [Spirochaetaceae bacterium]|nr:MAG: (2Fe-2S) ferredoxin domain-containing protein [Spirochaetaceae bacterium]
MAKMTLDDLRKLRESKRRDLDMRDPDTKNIQIIVGMGTSGIAAGAKQTLDAFIDELQQHDLRNVSVRQTGSLGLDHAEPTVEVKMGGMPHVIYGKVTGEIARRIIREHILGKTLVDEHIYDRPAADIVEKQ